MSTSSATFWHKFFVAAGIPLQNASAYAASFSQNRVTSDMLSDLNKDYLKDLGVKLLGDVIAILKHADKIQNEKAQKKAFGKPKTPNKKFSSSRQLINGNKNTFNQQEKVTTIPSAEVSIDENDVHIELEQDQRTSDQCRASEFVMRSDEGITNNQPSEVLKRLGKIVDEKVLDKSRVKDYYTSLNPGSVFKRLGKKTEKVPNVETEIPQNILSRLGQDNGNQESKRIAESVILSRKPTLQVRPKMTMISAGVLSPNSLQPPSVSNPSDGIFGPNRIASRSLAERLGKKVEDKTADQRLPINALAISKFLK